MSKGKVIVFFSVIFLIISLFLPLSPLYGQADPVIIHDQYEWNGTNPDPPCAEGPIHFTSNLHAIVVVRDDANGGFHITFHLNQHLLAWDDNGNEYIGSETINETFSCRAGNAFPWEYSFTQTSTCISLGSAPNLLYKERYNLKINANGQLTVYAELISFECKGD